MRGMLKVDPTRLLVFHQLKKRKIYVGELLYDLLQNLYTFNYDEHYLNLAGAIPLGPELDLFQKTHQSEGALFASFQDRIPEKANPAYKDYCISENISIDENNPIILLGSIGSRGPSSFVFEKTYQIYFNIHDIIMIRKQLQISQNDFALALGISKVTLQKIEAGNSEDFKTIKLLQIFFNFPEVAIWQLYQSSPYVHKEVASKLFKYFNLQLKQK